MVLEPEGPRTLVAGADTEIASLLGDLSNVPADHIRDVATIKRFLERWSMDPAYKELFEADADAAFAALGVTLRPEEVLPFIDPQEGDALWGRGGAEPRDWPLSVLRYRAFCQEKRGHRRLIRAESCPENARIATWRRRQINRCTGELGLSKSDAIVHAPAALELSKGCTVGCWFCGVSAPRHNSDFPYNAEHAALWKGTLATLRDVMGPCASQAFLYWATDPLDNADYEQFLVDFWSTLGRCPQTTTAKGAKDFERTRRLLALAASLESSIDRFSIVTLKSLLRIHAAMSPEELLRVECIPQNREAGKQYVKSNAGRARTFQERRPGEMAPEENSSTIACVSGFLLNMLDRSVQLVTPCNANARWPLGYWVLGEGTFDSPAELRELLDELCEEHMRTNLRLDDRVDLREDLRVEVHDGEIHILSRWLKSMLRHHAQPDELAALLAEGGHTVEEVALRRERDAGVSLPETLFFLEDLFSRGLLHEEPPAPEPDGGVERLEAVRGAT